MSADDGVADTTGRSGVARFLVRTALDSEFRELALRAPEEAFRGFDLSDEDKATLRSGDAGMLRLLGAALRADDAETGPAAGAPPRRARPPEPSPAVAAPPVRLPTLSFQLNVEPSLLQTPEGLRVSCAVSMQQVRQIAGGAAPAAVAPSASPPKDWSAWDHDLDSERTRAAAAAVRAAGRDQRFDRILDLIAAITSHERVGGSDG